MRTPALPLDGVTSDQPPTRCPRCGTDVSLTDTGKLTAHGPPVARCPAGGLRPAQARARLADHTRPTT